MAVSGVNDAHTQQSAALVVTSAMLGPMDTIPILAALMLAVDYHIRSPWLKYGPPVGSYCE